VIEFLLKARHVTLGAVIALLVFLAILGKRVGYEQSIQSFFAEDDPAIVAYREASKSFGDDNFVFVSYDDPALLTPSGIARVAELARAIGGGSIPGVARVESLDAMPQLWKVDDALLAIESLPRFARVLAEKAAKGGAKRVDLSSDAFTIAGAVRSAAGDPKALAALKARLVAHPLFRGTLIDGSGTSTAVVARLRKTDEHNVIETVAALRKAADEFAARHGLKGRPAVVGPPVLLADGFSSIEKDGRRLAAVGMILIAFVTLSAVRSLWWALVPMIAGWTVWLATEATLATLGLRLSLSGGPLVAQIIVLTMPAASHLAIHFRDEMRKAGDRRASARATLAAVSVPILWCAITGAIGYGALATSDVVPIQQFGWILGLCTLFSSLVVMAISPSAMLPPFRLEMPVRQGSSSMAGRGVDRVVGWVVGRPLPIVVAVLAVVLPLAVGMGRLRYETNYINAFQPETRVVRDYRTVERRLGGIGLVGVIVPVGETIGPEELAKFARFGRDYAGSPTVVDREGTPRPLSLATVLDPDGRLAKAGPDSTARLLATKLDLIAASPQADLLKSFWNRETGQARILVRLLEQQPANAKTAAFDRAVALARDSFGPASSLTGLSYLLTKTTRALVRTQWVTFTWSVVGILAMLTIALRRPGLAVLAMMPTLLAVGFVLGLMGWLGIKLDLATALVASVALGLSVDDTFHCLLQFRRQRATKDFAESLAASYSVSGPGVLLSSLAVAVGFGALRLSEFTPFIIFGTMVGIATAGSTLGNLVFLPACLALLERRGARERAEQVLKAA